MSVARIPTSCVDLRQTSMCMTCWYLITEICCLTNRSCDALVCRCLYDFLACIVTPIIAYSHILTRYRPITMSRLTAGIKAINRNTFIVIYESISVSLTLIQNNSSLSEMQTTIWEDTFIGYFRVNVLKHSFTQRVIKCMLRPAAYKAKWLL